MARPINAVTVLAPFELVTQMLPLASIATAKGEPSCASVPKPAEGESGVPGVGEAEPENSLMVALWRLPVQILPAPSMAIPWGWSTPSTGLSGEEHCACARHLADAVAEIIGYPKHCRPGRTATPLAPSQQVIGVIFEPSGEMRVMVLELWLATQALWLASTATDTGRASWPDPHAVAPFTAMPVLARRVISGSP